MFDLSSYKAFLLNTTTFTMECDKITRERIITNAKDRLTGILV